jgi:hypothetical protein
MREQSSMDETLPGKAESIEEFFQSHREDLGRVMDIAQEVREWIRAVDPFMQQHTSVICPHCRKVCCINRHAYYNHDDLIYIYALGLKPYEHECREDTEPCQFLSGKGCKLDRTVRPSGCNWYFCDSLFLSMEKTSGKAYVEFDDSLQKLADLWVELITEFRVTFRKITGHEAG